MSRPPIGTPAPSFPVFIIADVTNRSSVDIYTVQLPTSLLEVNRKEYGDEAGVITAVRSEREHVRHRETRLAPRHQGLAPITVARLSHSERSIYCFFKTKYSQETLRINYFDDI